MKFNGRGGRASVCVGKRVFQRVSYFPWMSSMPSNEGNGLQCVSESLRHFQTFWVLVFWSLVVQYFSFAICTAVFHWLHISFACNCNLLSVQFFW
jgi:hypothetical protein